MADPSQPWLNDPVVASTSSGYATTFADQSDLEAYANAKAQGKTEEEALKVGDNGVGSKDLGSIATPNAYGVAVPRSELERVFGSDPGAWRTARAVVNFNGQNVTVPIVDEGPGSEAQARGVVTDFSGPLAKALKSQGYDPAHIALVANAGPDYQNDPNAWYAEQQKIRGKLPDAGPWSKDPVVGQPKQTEQAKPWLNDPVVKQPAQKDQQQPWKSDALATNHPAAQQNGWNLGQSVKNIWDVATAQYAKAGLGTAESEAQQKPLGSDPYEQRIKEIQVDPNLNDQQKQESIADTRRLQDQHRATEVPKAQSAFTAAEKQVQQDNPNPVEKTLGSAIPYATSGLGGATAPILAAQQATAEMYADTFDTSTKRLKELHPDWSDGKILTQAVKAASEASRASGESMLALSMVDIPAAGPIISRIAQKIGIGAASMEVANTYAQVQRNMALQKDVDPKQDLLDGLKDLEFHVTNVVSGGAFGGLHGLGGEIGRPSTTPIEDRVPIAEVPDTKQEAPKSEETPKKEAAEQRPEHFVPSKEWQDVPDGLAMPPGGEYKVNITTGARQARWDKPPGPETVIDTKTGKPQTEPIKEPTPEESKAYKAEPEEPEKIKSVDISPTKDGKWQLTVNGKEGATFDTEEQAFEERTKLLQPEVDEHNAQPVLLSSESLLYGKQGQGPTGERVVSAAVRVGDRVLTGPNHPLILEDAPYELGMNPGDAPLQAEHGFVTSTGRFVDRREAWEIANPNKEVPIFGMGSEDIKIQAPEPVTDTEQWLSSIANRYTQPRSEAGEIGEVTPGTGTTPQEMVQKGLQMGPEKIAQHVSDLMQGKGDFREQAAAVRAREAQLSQDADRLSKIAEANPNDAQAKANYEEAFQHLTDFHNGPVAKLKNNWHAAGEALQGELPVDLGSFNGLREAWLRDVGKEPSERVQQTMRDTAQKVRRASAAEDMAMKSLGKEIEKPTRTKIPTSDEARANILARMKGDEPCGI